MSLLNRKTLLESIGLAGKKCIIHHIDRNPHNNKHDNLLILENIKEHSELHRRIRKKRFDTILRAVPLSEVGALKLRAMAMRQGRGTKQIVEEMMILSENSMTKIDLLPIPEIAIEKFGTKRQRRIALEDARGMRDKIKQENKKRVLGCPGGKIESRDFFSLGPKRD